MLLLKIRIFYNNTKSEFKVLKIHSTLGANVEAPEVIESSAALGSRWVLAGWRVIGLANS